MFLQKFLTNLVRYSESEMGFALLEAPHFVKKNGTPKGVPFKCGLTNCFPLP